MTQAPAKNSERYGRTRVSRIRSRIDKLRIAIRAQGTEDIQDAWDDLEGFLPYLQSPTTEDGTAGKD